MKTLHCEWCGQRESNEYPIWGHKESAEASYFISHKTRGYCVMAALARAEAAEALAAERLEAALFAELRAEEAAAHAQTAEEELEAERETTDETNGFIDSLIAALDHPIRGDEVFLSEIVETATALKARVAELEAAQQWRPVGVNPPPAGRMFEIRRANCSLFPTYAYGRPAQMAVGNLDGEFICWWVFGNGWEWRPHYELQPAPDQEPK